MNFFKKKYRIVTDRYCGYEVQIKRWWLPFWYQAEGVNTHGSIEAAERWAERYAKQRSLVKELGSFEGEEYREESSLDVNDC